MPKSSADTLRNRLRNNFCLIPKLKKSLSKSIISIILLNFFFLFYYQRLLCQRNYQKELHKTEKLVMIKCLLVFKKS